MTNINNMYAEANKLIEKGRYKAVVNLWTNGLPRNNDPAELKGIVWRFLCNKGCELKDKAFMADNSIKKLEYFRGALTFFSGASSLKEFAPKNESFDHVESLIYECCQQIDENLFKQGKYEEIVDLWTNELYKNSRSDEFMQKACESLYSKGCELKEKASRIIDFIEKFNLLEGALIFFLCVDDLKKFVPENNSFKTLKTLRKECADEINKCPDQIYQYEYSEDESDYEVFTYEDSLEISDKALDEILASLDEKTVSRKIIVYNEYM